MMAAPLSGVAINLKLLKPLCPGNFGRPGEKQPRRVNLGVAHAGSISPRVVEKTSNLSCVFNCLLDQDLGFCSVRLIAIAEADDGALCPFTMLKPQPSPVI